MKDFEGFPEDVYQQLEISHALIDSEAESIPSICSCDKAFQKDDWIRHKIRGECKTDNLRCPIGMDCLGIAGLINGKSSTYKRMLYNHIITKKCTAEIECGICKRTDSFHNVIL